MDEGFAALAEYDWEHAISVFVTALEASETPDALAGLAEGHYWLGHYPQAIALQERAFGLFVQADRPQPAARTAIRLALLHGLIFGNAVAVSGWVGHAVRLLDGIEECAEQGHMEVFLACIADDPAERERRARTALALARRVGDRSLEYDALAYLGQALVEQGDVADGMALIDQSVAAVSGGLVADAWVAGEIYCVLFHTCELVSDVQRAQAWLGAVDHYVARTRELPISGICRMHYGGLLTAAGRWPEAEHELTQALAIYDSGYVGTRFEAALRLADLRARQGRLEEAAWLVEGYEEHPAAATPLARLHLARGEHAQAAAVLERDLVRSGDSLFAVETLALLVQVELARGAVKSARTVVTRLQTVAQRANLDGITGHATHGAGRLCVAEGDHKGAEAAFRAAITAFAAADRHLNLAAVRLELGAVLAAERPDAAKVELQRALATFQQVDAALECDRAARLLSRLETVPPPDRAAVLTPRESEVLTMVSSGLTNRDIAAGLVISVRTAEHHVSQILSKLGAANRTEAAAIAADERYTRSISRSS